MMAEMFLNQDRFQHGFSCWLREKILLRIISGYYKNRCNVIYDAPVEPGTKSLIVTFMIRGSCVPLPSHSTFYFTLTKLMITFWAHFWFPSTPPSTSAAAWRDSYYRSLRITKNKRNLGLESVQHTQFEKMSVRLEHIFRIAGPSCLG
jgi:hypothetical protein